MFETPKTLSIQIAEHLQDRIIKLDIKPGERILEARIASELGVSQSPIREALRMLEKVRLVRQTPRHGTHVTGISEDFIVSIYDVFIELVSLATRKTAQNRTDSDVRDIKILSERIQEYVAKRDLYNFNQYFFQWGLRCLKAAYDPLLEELILDLTPSIMRIQYMSLLHRDFEEIRNRVKGVDLSTSLIEAKKIDEAEKNNRVYLIEEKKVIIDIYRKHFNV